MKKGKLAILCMLALLLLFGSCASSGSSAMRKAERQMARTEKRSAKQYDKAKSAHYKHQSKKTKRMMKQDQRRSEHMRRHHRSNPYYWRLSSGGNPLLGWHEIHRLGQKSGCNWKIAAEVAKKVTQLLFLQMTENQKYKYLEKIFSRKKRRKSTFFLRTFK